MKYFTLFSLVVLLSLISCKKDECKEEQMSVASLESDYGCKDTKNALQVNITDNVVLIRTKTDYDTRVTGVCHPQIDFTKYDLVIGKQGLDFKNDTILYDYRKTCPAKDLALTIDLVQSAVTFQDTVVYHAIIPKLASQENLNVYINVR